MMSTKNYAMMLAVASSLLLAGCNKSDIEPAAASNEVAQDSVASDTNPQGSNESQVQEGMPYGFVVPFAATTIRDQEVESNQGIKQRRILLNAPGITPADAEKKLEEAFIAAGFKGGKVAEKEGKRSINYRRDGKVVVVVSVGATDQGGAEIRFGWNI